MRAGRFACVALPIILTIAAIIAFLVATLSGIAHNSLYIFSVNLKDISLDPATLESLAKNLDIDLPSASDIPDLPDNIDLDNLDASDIPDDVDLSGIDIPGLNSRQAEGLTAADLNLGNKYEITLWGYCEIKDKKGEDGTEKDCIDGEYNWASKHLDTDFIDKMGAAAGVDVKLPDEIDSALGVFKTVTRYTEIAFIVALAVLGLELLLGIFASCTRIMSCLTWLIGIAAIVLCVVAAGLATAMGAVVVGAVEATAKQYGVRGSINTNFLVCVWMGAAFAIAASLFWLFTLCCCKPDHGRRGDKNKYADEDSEKLMPSRGYYPIGGTGLNDADRTPNTGYHNQFQPTYGQDYSHAPSYYSGGRSDAGYEPYAHRG